MSEQIVRVTPQQFASVQRSLQRNSDVVYKSVSYAAASDALRSVGIEPVDGITYRFEVIPEED